MSSPSSPYIATVVKMLESLPTVLQEKVVEQVREFIADLEDEERWQASFEQTHERLIASAQSLKLNKIPTALKIWITHPGLRPPLRGGDLLQADSIKAIYIGV